MSASSVSAKDDSNSGIALADYSSMMLQKYSETLARSKNAEVLDVGPVCEENIMYFAKRVKRLHVCDIFLQLNRNRHNGWPTDMVWKHLDYAPQSFDGINLWDFMDHLEDRDIDSLMALCHTFLKPGALIMVTSFEEQSVPSHINSFVIQDGFRVAFRHQFHMDLPWYYRSNRIITQLLSGFRTVKSFLYRNGVREFLCKA